MLQLHQIKKEYPAGNGKVEALKGIDLRFRRSEFVSILGPSGCGKTTMLNIIGGLDGYTEGDLIINGRSTKQFKDRDWDAYRNHSIGFVFQSYNLIPHQTVLQNVELALTLSGVSRSERRARAKKALEDVGLGDQLKKRPGEMSGGQMQRVAIARALVNNPDIILADEPTGALDTETSVQVMEILKSISKDRLIIMVTHNPDLAEQYSTRIIRMLDGVITDDSRPLTDEEIRETEAAYAARSGTKIKKTKKPSMSFATSFMLSLKNLFTKKGRTTLTAFAGSIGIIGIALILSVSQGTTAYIDSVQEETLSAYPLTLESTSMNLTSLMETFMNVNSENVTHEKDAVYKKSALYDIVNAMSELTSSVKENDLKSFAAYLQEELAKEGSVLNQALNGVQYTYDMDLQVYTKTPDGEVLFSNTEEVLREILTSYMGEMAVSQVESSPMSSMGMMPTGLWQEILPGKNGEMVNPVVMDQYDVIDGGRWPSAYNEIVLVVDKNNELDDVTLYALGLLAEEKIYELTEAAKNGTSLESEEMRWTYDELRQREYRVALAADCFAYNEITKTYVDLRESELGRNQLYDRAMTLKITGIIRPKEGATASVLGSGIAYTHALTDHVIANAAKSSAISAQKDNPQTDVLTGLPFKQTGTLTDEQKATEFLTKYNTMSNAQKIDLFVAINSYVSDEMLEQAVTTQFQTMTREDILASWQAENGEVTKEQIDYFMNLSDEELLEVCRPLFEKAVLAQAEAAAQAAVQTMGDAAVLETLNGLVADATMHPYYYQFLAFSETTYEDNLRTLGYVDKTTPATISLYASTFEDKEVVEQEIAHYNDGVQEEKRIQYTDYVGLIMTSVTTIIDAITYVLIAFVAISLIVSSIMIGVITLISVQERTKEIGILRAIGASKRNVSGMFNAETVIVGFTAGLLGVVVTYLLCIPINMLLNHFTGLPNLQAQLPFGAAVILVAISVLLTLISGIIPSRSAAKKDPVVALRTE